MPPPSEPEGGPGRLPNLLVIGAQKAGTTWLHRRLSKHPAVLMSRAKEPNGFGRADYESHLDAYRANFPTTLGKRYYGEGTPGYFWTWAPPSPWLKRYLNGNRDIPGSVRRTLGADIKLILSLRHPVERAVSAFYHHFIRGRVDRQARIAEVGTDWGILDIGRYQRHWQTWSREFDEAAFLVVLFDEIVMRPAGVLARIQSHLGLSMPFGEAVTQEHAGLRLRVVGDTLEVDPDRAENRRLADHWGCDLAAAPKVSAADLRELDSFYAEDIIFCQTKWCDAAGVDWKAPRRVFDFAATA